MALPRRAALPRPALLRLLAAAALLACVAHSLPTTEVAGIAPDPQYWQPPSAAPTSTYAGQLGTSTTLPGTISCVAVDPNSGVAYIAAYTYMGAFLWRYGLRLC